MTKTYLIHAWCIRPFITLLDPVEAATPEEAISIARQKPAKLLDAAEECNAQYPWDEFAAFDSAGNELLHVLDEESRLREAAPDLRAALEYALEYLKANDDGEDDVAPRIAVASAALTKAGTVGPAFSPAVACMPIVTISVQGGIIEDLAATVPVTVVVEDWDAPDEETGKKPTRSVHALTGGMSGPKAAKLRQLIANV